MNKETYNYGKIAFKRSEFELTILYDESAYGKIRYTQSINTITKQLNPIHWNSHGYYGTLEVEERRVCTEILEKEYQKLIILEGEQSCTTQS